MGSGKTSWSIQHINKERFDNFLYITPFLEEVERIIENTDREFNGTLKQISKHFNVDYNTLIRKYKKLNIPIEEIIDSNYKRNIRNKIYIVFKNTDKEFYAKNLKKISNHFYIKISNLYCKINEGLSIEEAILLPLKKVNQNNLFYKGQKGTMRELCQKFDKNFIEVYNKVKYNHTFEWAMDSTITPYDLNNNDDYNCNDN